MKEAFTWIVLNDQGDYYQKEPKIEKSADTPVSFADSWSSSQKILDLKKKKKKKILYGASHNWYNTTGSFLGKQKASYICWFSCKLMDSMDKYESDFRSNEHCISSSENKAWKSNFFSCT